MANLITGAKGEAHITPMQDALWHRGIMGVQDCILDINDKLAPYIVVGDNQHIRILSGVGMLQGRFFEIDDGAYDLVNIPNGAQGYNRIDIVCAKITQNENGTQTFSWQVVQGTQTSGTPQPPTVEEHSLDDGDEFALMPIASVELNGVNIVAVETVAEIGTTADKALEIFESWKNGIYKLYESGSASMTVTQKTIKMITIPPNCVYSFSLSLVYSATQPKLASIYGGGYHYAVGGTVNNMCTATLSGATQNEERTLSFGAAYNAAGNNGYVISGYYIPLL